VDETAVIDQLFDQCKRDHQRWINGDPGGYRFETDDATLMGAFGGLVVGTATATPRQQGRVSQFESGEGDIELVASGVAGSLAWLVMIERASVRFAGRDTPSRWELRVTELFRSHDDRWIRIHRHADPLVDLHTLDDVTSLLD
jgi:hypothetical protein